MKRQRQGSLIMVLLVLTFFFLVCIGYLARQPLGASAASASLLESQARALAEAGMEDVRCKLMKDWKFPPMVSEDQPVLSYTDEMLDLDGRRCGVFRVTLDRSWQGHPFFCYKVTSEGMVGTQDRPEAIYQIQGVFDIATQKRGGTGLNPDYWEWIEWNETT